MVIILTTITLFLCSGVLAADEAYWIFLTDKGEQNESRDDTWIDQTLNKAYLQVLRDQGLSIRTSSRWLNAVSVNMPDDMEHDHLKQLIFVAGIRPVRQSLPRTMQSLDRRISPAATLDYGNSFQQNDLLDIPEMHSRGFDGRGVRIAIFDTGFRLDHPAFDGLDVVATYDFIDNEVDVDGFGDDHGMNTLSILGGYHPGELIGPAYGASFLLARTEDDLREIPAEEDHWVAALEWADSIGVDIVSSSLNYREFDDPAYNYSALDMDGESTVITQATNIAAQRGILVVNAMGNEGPGMTSLWAPADGAHVLAVGSVNLAGNVSSFSGRGPTADGRTKPDVVALGSSVYAATYGSDYTYVVGTSYATPVVAGAAAILLQHNPLLTPDSIITAFRNSGSVADSPDNGLGWGIPSLVAIMGEEKPYETREIRSYPNPYSGGGLIFLVPDGTITTNERVMLYNVLGQKVWSGTGIRINRSMLSITLPEDPDWADQVFLVDMGHGRLGRFLWLK